MRLVLIIGLVFMGLSIHGQQVDYNLKDDYIANGYDVVSYFDGTALKGKKELVYEYDGIKLKFSSMTNLERFKSDPQQFMPQYGGWCAYAVAVKGEKVKINPKTFEIRDGKLYLFYNKWSTNTLEKWLDEGPEALKNRADQNWQDLKNPKK